MYTPKTQERDYDKYGRERTRQPPKDEEERKRQRQTCLQPVRNTGTYRGSVTRLWLAGGSFLLATAIIEIRFYVKGYVRILSDAGTTGYLWKDIYLRDEHEREQEQTQTNRPIRPVRSKQNPESQLITVFHFQMFRFWRDLLSEGKTSVIRIFHPIWIYGTFGSSTMLFEFGSVDDKQHSSH